MGIDAPPVSVEVHLANGLPAFHIVGLPDAEVRESRERVRAALLNAGFEFPNRRITVNLAPADLPKASGRFDLPIAIGILAAAAGLPPARLQAVELMGELSLTGELRAVRGALVLALAVRRSQSRRLLVLPAASAAEAAAAGYEGTRAADHLSQVWDAISRGRPLPEPINDKLNSKSEQLLTLPDLADVRGQTGAKRALEIAAAGGHSLLMTGPPGTGKSMLAQRLPGLLPPMTQEEALESAAVQSLCASGFNADTWGCRPFRTPHHSTSGPALVGGGSTPRPGEVSLAHQGVLFLDEVAEFPRTVLDTLREPMETGRVSVSRANRQAEFPARFQLVAAMNPCPCGYFGHFNGRCHCPPDQIHRYRSRLSGPMLDRIDLHISVPALPFEDLTRARKAESSQAVRQRVTRARNLMLARQGKPNAHMNNSDIDRFCTLDASSQALLKEAVARLSLSARQAHRTVLLARSIADLEGVVDITRNHVGESLQYRALVSFCA